MTLRSYLASLAAVLIAVGPAVCQAPMVRLPQEVQGEAGLPVLLTATTDCAIVKWSKPRTGCGLIVFPGDAKNAYFFAQKAGRYYVRAWTAKGDVPSDEAVCVVVIGDVPGPVPPPGPGPAPPPVPPADPLLEKLKAPYAADATQDKVTAKVKLAALFRQAGDLVASGKAAKWGDLFDAMTAAAKATGCFGKLVPVQQVLSLEITAAIGTPARDAPIGALDVPKVSELFARIAKALEAL